MIEAGHPGRGKGAGALNTRTQHIGQFTIGIATDPCVGMFSNVGGKVGLPQRRFAWEGAATQRPVFAAVTLGAGHVNQPFTFRYAGAIRYDLQGGRLNRVSGNTTGLYVGGADTEQQNQHAKGVTEYFKCFPHDAYFDVCNDEAKVGAGSPGGLSHL